MLTDSVRLTMDRARDSSRRMDQVIEGWLAYTVTRNGNLSPAPVKIAELAEGLIEGNAGDQASWMPGPELSIDSDDVVVVDPTLLRQVLANLVGNSIKYAARVSRPGSGSAASAEAHGSRSASPTTGSASPRVRRSWSSARAGGPRRSASGSAATAWDSPCAARWSSVTAAGSGRHEIPRAGARSPSRSEQAPEHFSQSSRCDPAPVVAQTGVRGVRSPMFWRRPTAIIEANIEEPP